MLKVVLLKTCTERDLTRVLTPKAEHRSVLMSWVTIRCRNVNTLSEVLIRETLDFEPSLDLNLKKSEEWCSNNVLQHHEHDVTMETLSPPADLYVLWISSWAFDHYLLTICFSVISVTQPAGLSDKVSGGLKDLCWRTRSGAEELHWLHPVNKGRAEPGQLHFTH